MLKTTGRGGNAKRRDKISELIEWDKCTYIMFVLQSEKETTIDFYIFILNK